MTPIKSDPNTIIHPRFTDINGLMLYTSLGRNKAMQLAKRIHADHREGKRVIYDLKRVDDYFDSLEE